MADHAEVQYATAEGNDLPAHESGYTQFVFATFVGTALVINILLGLAIGGVLGGVGTDRAIGRSAGRATGAGDAWIGREGDFFNGSARAGAGMAFGPGRGAGSGVGFPSWSSTGAVAMAMR